MTSASVADVAQFYRKELAQIGWREVAYKIASKQASLTFKGSEGELLVEVGSAQGETKIELEQRNVNLARRDNLLPRDGEALLIMGNATRSNVQLQLNKRPFTLRAQQGTRSPKDAQRVRLSGGRYIVSWQLPGEAKAQETFEAQVGETWAVMLTPGGALPMRMW